MRLRMQFTVGGPRQRQLKAGVLRRSTVTTQWRSNDDLPGVEIRGILACDVHTLTHNKHVSRCVKVAEVTLLL